MRRDAQAFEPFLLELARLAAAETLPRFRSGVAAEDKGDGRYDPVTEADRAAERALRAAIRARFPGDGILGEEDGPERPAAGRQWIIDPVDGTRAFVAGLPLWTTLVGVEEEGAPVIGMVAQPVLGEVFAGGPGLGARLHAGGRSAEIRTRRGVPLARAAIATTDPALFEPERRAAWDRLAAATRFARLGCDAYAMAMVAMGTLDLVAEAGLKPWDMSGPRAVVLGAGGAVDRWPGGGEGDVVFAADALLAGAATSLLAREPPGSPT